MIKCAGGGIWFLSMFLSFPVAACHSCHVEISLIFVSSIWKCFLKCKEFQMLGNTDKRSGQCRRQLLGTSDVSQANSFSCFFCWYELSDWSPAEKLASPFSFPSKQLPVWFLLTPPTYISLVRFSIVLACGSWGGGRSKFSFHFHGYFSMK